MTRARWRWLAALWTAAIVVACSVPGPSLPPSPFLSFDKVVHVALFAPFALLWRRAVGPRDGAILLASAVFAVAIEVWQQLPVIGRSADPADALADVAGAILGLALARLVDRRQQA